MDNNNLYQGQNFKSEEPMSLGTWMITILLTAIPCVGLIMLLIWAFGSNTLTTKKNYARAMLIYAVIAIVLYVLSMVIFGVAFASLYANNRY